MGKLPQSKLYFSNPIYLHLLSLNYRASALDSFFKEMSELVIEYLKIVSKDLLPKLYKKVVSETVKYLRSKPVDIN